MNGLNRIPTLIRMCLASVITNLGMTLIQTRLKIPPPAPLSLSPLLPPRRCPVRCPPRSRPPFAHPPVCVPPSFLRRQGVQQGEPAPAISTASPFTPPSIPALLFVPPVSSPARFARMGMLLWECAPPSGRARSPPRVVSRHHMLRFGHASFSFSLSDSLRLRAETPMTQLDSDS